MSFPKREGDDSLSNVASNPWETSTRCCVERDIRGWELGGPSPELTCPGGSLGALHSVAVSGGEEAPGHAGVALGAPAAATEGAGALSKDRRGTDQLGLHR